MLRKMLKKNPKERITIPEILDNVWFKKNRSSMVEDENSPTKVTERNVIIKLLEYDPPSILHQMAIRVLVTYIDKKYTKPLSDEYAKLDWDQNGFLQANEIEGALKEAKIPEVTTKMA